MPTTRGLNYQLLIFLWLWTMHWVECLVRVSIRPTKLDLDAPCDQVQGFSIKFQGYDYTCKSQIKCEEYYPQIIFEPTNALEIVECLYDVYTKLGLRKRNLTVGLTVGGEQYQLHFPFWLTFKNFPVDLGIDTSNMGDYDETFTRQAEVVVRKGEHRFKAKLHATVVMRCEPGWQGYDCEKRMQDEEEAMQVVMEQERKFREIEIKKKCSGKKIFDAILFGASHKVLPNEMHIIVPLVLISVIEFFVILILWAFLYYRR